MSNLENEVIENKKISMKEAFKLIKPSKSAIKVGINGKNKRTFRDWLWDYPNNVVEFFKKTSPLSFIFIFTVLGLGIFSFFRSNIFADLVTSEKTQIFVEGNVGAISSFNPLYITQNVVDSDIQALVFEKFIEISKDGQPKEKIAKDWVVSGDGKTYDFTINLDHKWQDGVPLTIDDVIFTFEIAKELYTEYGDDTIGASLGDVTVNKISEDKLRFTLPESNATFFEAVSVYIVPKHILERIPVTDIAFNSFTRYPLGSGPYEVYRSEPNVVYLKASEYYWVNPKIETFIYRLYSDYDALESAFRNGVLDAMGGTDSGSMSFVNEYSGYLIKEIPLDSRVRMIFFNTRKEKFENKDLRIALNHITNKELLLEQTNLSASISNGPIAKSSWAYSEKNVVTYGYDPVKAQEIFKNAVYTRNENSGYYETEDKKVLSFTLSYYDNNLNNRIANSLKDIWKDEGVVLNLEPLSYTQLTQEIVATRDFELLMYEVETTVDPDQYNLWHSLKSSYPDLNLSGYSYERVDILLEDARRSTKIETRKSSYALFQKYLTQDSPVIFLFNPNYTYVYKEGIQISDIGNINYPYQRFEDVAYWSK